MFREADGKLSFSRISSAVVLSAWLVWVSYCVFNTKALPGGTWEVSTLIGTLYGLNKVSAAIAGTPTAPGTVSSTSKTSDTVTMKAS